MRRSILAVFQLLLLVGTFFVHILHKNYATEDNSDKSINALITALASDSFEVREAATRALKERREAIPALRKARQKTDLEVRRRMDEVLLTLERKEALRELSKVTALGNAGRAVEVADRLAFTAKYNQPGERGWDSLTRFAEQIIARTDLFFSPAAKFYGNREFPGGDFGRFAKLLNPKEIAQIEIEIDTGTDPDPTSAKMMAANKFIRDNYGRFLLRGERVSLTGRGPLFQLCSGIIAASGDVQVTSAMNSLIVAGGDVKKIERMRHCILLCDGDVQLLDGWGVTDSIIIARGRVAWKGGKLRNCFIRSGHKILLPNALLMSEAKTIDMKEGAPDSPALAMFFELSDLGLFVEEPGSNEKSDVSGVRIKNLRKQSAFSCELQVGDLITAIEDKKTPTTEVFRRTLRRKLAEGGPIHYLSVLRSGKALELPYAVRD